MRKIKDEEFKKLPKEVQEEIIDRENQMQFILPNFFTVCHGVEITSKQTKFKEVKKA